MLAQRLARIAQEGKPVRYARDPAVDQAIRNYLAIALRARGIPFILRGARHAGAGGRALPRVGSAIEALLEGHDATDLAGALDMLQDEGYDPQQEPQYGANYSHLAHLTQVLGAIQRSIAHPRHGGQPSPRLLRNYTEEGLGADQIRNLVGENYLQTPGENYSLEYTLMNLIEALRGQRLHTQADQAEHYYDYALDDGHPLSLVGLHDLATVVRDPLSRPIQGVLEDTRRKASKILHHAVLPNLPVD